MDGKQLEVTGNKGEEVTTGEKPSPQPGTFRDTLQDGTKLAVVVEDTRLFCLEIKDKSDSQGLWSSGTETPKYI